MSRDPNEIAASFVKGRIGEEIVNQLFSRMGYEVLPIGVEHTNLKTLYGKCAKGDFLFMHSRRMPDFCLVMNDVYRYVEVKFRYRNKADLNTSKYVIKTFFETYYHQDKDRHGNKINRYKPEHGPFKNVLMLWLFMDEPALLKVEDLAKHIKLHGDKVDWDMARMDEYINAGWQIGWDKPHLFSNGDIQEQNKINERHWGNFKKSYSIILKKVLG